VTPLFLNYKMEKNNILDQVRIIRIRDKDNNFHGMLIAPETIALQLADDIDSSFNSMDTQYHAEPGEILNQ